MDRCSWALVVVLLLLASAQVPVDYVPPPSSSQAEGPPDPPAANEDGTIDIGGFSRGFVENLGQLDDHRVRFLMAGEGMTVGLLPDRLVVGLRPTVNGSRGHTFEMRFEGCEPVDPRGSGPQVHATNFLIGRDPCGWVTGARTFDEVTYEGLYEGIDLRLYLRGGVLKYDLDVAPGADASRVWFHYIGVDALELEPSSGDLLVRTPEGTVRDARPLVLQEWPDGERCFEGSFVLEDGHRCGFWMPGAVRRDLPAVIDPGLRFSTYLGGTAEEESNTLLLTASGDVVVGGSTDSIDMPTSTGAFEEDLQGSLDGFVARFDHGLGTLRFCTYIGGNQTDAVSDVIEQDDGSLVVFGYTWSPDCPTTSDALHKDQIGDSDIVVWRLSADGSTLLNGTYLGGTGLEYIKCARLDGDGSMLLTGQTESYDLPVTGGAYCSTFNGVQDGYIIRLDNNLSSIDMCTYVGGTGSEIEFTLAIGTQGDIYLTGNTDSEDFLTTAGAFCETIADGGTNVFVIRLSSDGTRLLGSTLFGGTGADWVRDLAIGPDGDLFITGFTLSDDLHTTPDALRTELIGIYDGYLAVLSGDVTELRFSTYFGGNDTDNEGSTGLAIMPSGDAVALIGFTNARDFPTTVGAFDRTVRGDVDIFVTIVNVSSPRIEYSTLVGGYNTDWNDWAGIVVDTSGLIYVKAYTLGGMFMVPGAARAAHAGSYDVYVGALNPRPCDVQGPIVGLDAISGEGSIYLLWDQPEFVGCMITSIRVWRSTDNRTFEPLEDIHPGSLDYRDDTIAQGIRYYYRLSIVNTAGDGPVSATVSGLAQGLPSKPLCLASHLNTNNGTVTLCWSPPVSSGGGEILGYKVNRWRPGGTKRTTTLGNVTNHTDTEVLTGVQYSYSVSAFNHKGEGPSSDTISITPLGPPGKPRGLTIDPGDRRLTVSWQPPEDSGGTAVNGYLVYRGASVFEMELWRNVSASVTSVVDMNLTNGATYYYYVMAFNRVAIGPPTAPQQAVPYTIPSAPRFLEAVAGDRHVVLSWSAPVDDGGKPVSGYRVYFSMSEGGIPTTIDLGNVTSYTHEELPNGVPHHYQVTACTMAGEGPRSNKISATPMGVPGQPQGLQVRSQPDGIALNWSSPKEWGGARSLNYTVLRGTSPDRLLPIANLTDQTSYKDSTGVGGVNYHYAVMACNQMGEGGVTEAVSATVLTVPRDVGAFCATAGVGWVLLSWSSPSDDGGSGVTGYVVLRGTIQGSLSRHVSTGSVLTYNDTEVTNGITYYYAVFAVNAVGDGSACGEASATPMALPQAPGAFKVKTGSDNVVLTWTEPIAADSAPVTGYLVMRGTSKGSLDVIAELGTVVTYHDEDVNEGKTYYYQVIPVSAMGTGQATSTVRAVLGPEVGSALSWSWLALLVLLVVILGAVGLYAYRRRAEAPTGLPDVPEEVPLQLVVDVPTVPPGEAGVEGSAGSDVAALELASYLVEEVLLVYKDGRLIASCAREECGTPDADLMSGMLIAVQGLIQDGLDRGGALKGIQYGENLISVVGGEHVVLASVMYGRPDAVLTDQLEDTVRRIEGAYSGVIENWTGDPAAFTKIQEILEPLIYATSFLTREDVSGAITARGVALLSAVDFHRGYVRLKMAAVNATKETIIDTAIEVRYNPDMLRLERVEPDTLASRGDRVPLGNVKPGERKTVALLFDPQICQGTHIDGHLSYYDSKGELRYVEMKRRHADVVCPIFFTRENANKAMLRRLIKERLHMSDLRVYRYPQELDARDVLSMGRAALEGGDVQVVREYIVEGPPLEAEVWYYAETRVSGLQFVMRLGVVEEKGVLELFAASTAMEPITGLLAEFRKDLDHVLRDRHPEKVAMVVDRDEDLRRDLERRPLMLDTDDE